MKLIKTLLIVLFISTSTFAQTFKITGVTASSDEMFNRIKKNSVGAIAKLEIFDNAARLKIGDGDFLLKQTADNKYQISELKSGDREITTLILDKYMGFIRSITFMFEVKETGGKSRHVWVKYTGKREF